MYTSTKSRKATGSNLLVASVMLSTSLMASPGWAANPAFQDFFFDVCVNPSAALAVRCAETDGALGNLSGDSESSLNPSQTLSTADAAVYAAQQRSQDIRERLREQREGESVEDGARVDLGRFSLLINARTGSSESDRTLDVDAERGYELDERGAELGLDYRINENLVWGAWLQWGTSELDFDRENPGVNFAPSADAGGIDTDRFGVTTYLSAQFAEGGFIDASLGYSQLEVDASRNSIFQESNRVIAQTNSLTSGDADGDELMFTLTAGYQTDAGGWNVTPFVGITYIDTEFDDYVESDLSASGLALDVALGDQSVLMGQAGVTLSRAISMEGWVMLPQLRVEYLAELDRDRSEAGVSFVNDVDGNLFRMRGDDLDSDRVDISIGVAGVLRNGWIPFIEYQQTTANDDLDRYQISAGLRVEL